jgi:copper(I)-binding protein
LDVTSGRRGRYDARMTIIMQRVLGLALIASASLAHAAVFNVTEPWVKPAPAGASTEAYMEIASSDGATIVDARSPVASSVSLAIAQARHEAPYALPLPRRTTVLLNAGGTRFALAKLVRPLKVGDRVPITLVVRNADATTQEIEVDAEVRRHSPSYDHGIGRVHH